MVSRLSAVFNIALLSTASAGRAAAGLPSFDSFIQKYGRSYQQGSAEYHMRASVYEKNRLAAEKQNSRADKLWTAGVNKLSDWSESEFKSLLGWDGSVRPSARSSHAIVRPHSNFLQQNVPEEKDWSKLEMSKQVKDQGPCGSCWAIAAATVLEGHYEIYSGKFRTFSAQQMVDCTPNPRKCGGTGGCGGATAELAMEFVMKHGCADENEIPYHAHDGQCTVGNSTVAAKPNKTQNIQVLMQKSIAPKNSGAAAFGMVGWETLPLNKYEPLLQALATKGPVAVSAAAGDWGSYMAGIFNGCQKDTVVNHAVTAIGYGVENGVKYWQIQNSWGADWGENGHIRLQRHDGDEYCGMNNDPQAGVACEGETDPVPVCGMCGVLFDSVVPHFKPSIA